MTALALVALGAVYGSDLAKAATVLPSYGGRFAARVLVTLPDTRDPFGKSILRARQVVVTVRASEWREPKKGDRLEFEDERFEVIAAPRFDDPQRLVWTLECEPVGPVPVAES